MVIKTGIIGNSELIVENKHTAIVVGSGNLSVLSTPTVVALVEETAWKSVKNALEIEQDTVGTEIDIKHIAPTPIGLKIHCKTILIEVDNRRLVFNFEVFDEKEKISFGTHERFIVNGKKFQEKTDNKKH